MRVRAAAPLFVATALAVLGGGGDIAAAAVFSASAARPTGAFSTATLQPVSGEGVTWWCPAGGGSAGSGYTATIAWDPSASPFAQSYVVEWATSAAGPWTLLSTTTSTAVQQTSIPKKTDRWWRITTAAYEWRSASVVVAGTAPNPAC